MRRRELLRCLVLSADDATVCVLDSGSGWLMIS